jgi:hypothetical protein
MFVLQFIPLIRMLVWFAMLKGAHRLYVNAPSFYFKLQNISAICLSMDIIRPLTSVMHLLCITYI